MHSHKGKQNNHETKCCEPNLQIYWILNTLGKEWKLWTWRQGASVETMEQLQCIHGWSCLPRSSGRQEQHCLVFVLFFKLHKYWFVFVFLFFSLLEIFFLFNTVCIPWLMFVPGEVLGMMCVQTRTQQSGHRQGGDLKLLMAIWGWWSKIMTELSILIQVITVVV